MVNYLYKIVKEYGNSFIAYENGKQLSDNKGDESYRSALRKYILPRMVAAVKERGLVVALESEHNLINKDNIDKFVSRYIYENILKKYTDSALTYQIHTSIDDWNQIRENSHGDQIHVNPHDIMVSLEHDFTFQELYEPYYYDYSSAQRFGSYSIGNNNTTTYQPHYFINGIPVSALLQVEQVTRDGLVVEEKEQKPDFINPIKIMVDLISDDASYVIYSDRNTKDGIFYDDSLEKLINDELEKRKRSVNRK